MRKEERWRVAIKDGNRRLAQGEGRVRRIWKEYFEDLYKTDTQEKVAVHMYGFDGIWRGNYFRREPIGRTEVKVRVGKLKNGKATGEMIKGGGGRVVDWICRLCNMAFERDVPGDWRSSVIVPLYKGKGERSVCKNYKGISLLSVVE